MHSESGHIYNLIYLVNLNKRTNKQTNIHANKQINKTDKILMIPEWGNSSNARRMDIWKRKRDKKMWRDRLRHITFVSVWSNPRKKEHMSIIHEQSLSKRETDPFKIKFQEKYSWSRQNLRLILQRTQVTKSPKLWTIKLRRNLRRWIFNDGSFILRVVMSQFTYMGIQTNVSSREFKNNLWLSNIPENPRNVSEKNSTRISRRKSSIQQSIIWKK